MNIYTWMLVNASDDKARPCHVAIMDGTFLDTCRNLGGCVVHGTDSYATIGTMTKVV